MEIITLSSYTEVEKLEIARRYLVDRQREANGLQPRQLQFGAGVIERMIAEYTRESGVRELERTIGSACRKAARQIVEGTKKSVRITKKNLPDYLGKVKYPVTKTEKKAAVGLCNGMAWTEVGGELLRIEAALVPGKGKLIHTGQLGEVMRESIQAAMTVVRSRAEMLGIDPDFHQNYDLHIHVPEGATPKDGPSAGIGMCTALVSALTRIPARASVAMTGEITLRGEVLPIGGLKEKLLAAHRGSVATVVIPEENRKDLVEIPENILARLEVRPVRWIDQVLEIALQTQPTPRVRDTVEQEEAVATPEPVAKTGGVLDGVRAH